MSEKASLSLTVTCASGQSGHGKTCRMGRSFLPVLMHCAEEEAGRGVGVDSFLCVNLNTSILLQGSNTLQGNKQLLHVLQQYSIQTEEEDACLSWPRHYSTAHTVTLKHRLL